MPLPHSIVVRFRSASRHRVHSPPFHAHRGDASDNVCLTVSRAELPMRVGRRQIVLVFWSVGILVVSNRALAQSPAPPPDATGQATSAGAGQHDHMQMNMPMNTPGSDGWQLMQDGILFAGFNHQGGSRGGNEFVSPHWWIGMATRRTP